MKATRIALCAVLAASLALCAASMIYQFHVLDDLEQRCDRAVECVRADDTGGAARVVADLRERFRKDSKILEMLSSHDDLHEADVSIVNAAVALECEDKDDALQALCALSETLEHLRAHESFSFSNLY